MSDPNVILTNITPPRVPLTDSRTGLISREWYRFFFNLFQLTGSGTNYASLTDLQLGPPQQEIDLTTVDPVPSGFSAYAAGSTQESQIAEIEKQLQALASTNDVNIMQSDLAEIWKQLQALQLVPQFPTSPLTTGSSILYGNDSGGFSNVTIGSGVSFTSGTLSATGTGGTVTSVTGTSPVVSSGGTAPAISLAAAYGDTLNPYASKTANYVLAAPSGSAGVPTFRALTSTDIPTLSYVSSVSGTTGRITSTGGLTPVIDLASGVATAGTTGSSTQIPVITIDTYGRVTTITTAANPQGTVTAVSVVSTNGLAGTSSGGATPALTLSTTITGILKGNGTAISAAVANTDYVGVSAPVTKTADFTVANGETWFINNKSGSTCTATLPTASSWSGRSMTFKNMQAQSLVSASSNVVPIDSTTSGTAILLPVIGNWATMVSDGTNWVIMQTAPNNILLLE